MQYIQLSHRVIEARWSETASRWDLKIQNLMDGKIIEDYCNVLLSATGVLKYVHGGHRLVAVDIDKLPKSVEVAGYSRTPPIQRTTAAFSAVGQPIRFRR